MSPNDAKEMLKQLGIYVNINEAKVLIAASDSKKKGELNIDEFMDMVFDENDHLNVELSKLSPGDRYARVEDEEKYLG